MIIRLLVALKITMTCQWFSIARIVYGNGNSMEFSPWNGIECHRNPMNSPWNGSKRVKHWQICFELSNSLLLACACVCLVALGLACDISKFVCLYAYVRDAFLFSYATGALVMQIAAEQRYRAHSR